jgi:hypothetical protein
MELGISASYIDGIGPLRYGAVDERAEPDDSALRRASGRIYPHNKLNALS